MSTTYANDTFVRANTAGNASISNVAGWGTSSDGNTWSETGSGATYSILSNLGTVTGTTNVILATLSATTKQDGDVLGLMKGSSTASHMGVIFRQTGTTTYYRAEVNGGNTFSLTKIVSGVSTDLVTSSTFTYAANTLVRIRLQCIGSSIAGKVWLDANTEPTSFTLTATDSAITGAGNFGFKCGLGSAGNTVSFGSFAATNALTTRVTGMRTRVRTQRTQSLGVRTVVRGITRVTGMRLPVRSKHTQSTSLRVRIYAALTKSVGLRLPLRTRLTPSVGIRLPVSLVTSFFSVYGTTNDAATMLTADQLADTTGGTSATSTIAVGMATGYGEIASDTIFTTWNSLDAIGAPTGLGWIQDDTSLEGLQIVSGNWQCSCTLAVSGGTIVTDLYMRAWKVGSDGTLTPLGVASLAAQTLTTTPTFYLMDTNTNFGFMTFFTGETLYTDIWGNIFSNTTGDPNATITNYTSSVVGKGLTGYVQFSTPGTVSWTGSTLSTGMRVRVRTQVWANTVLRTIVRTKSTLSAVLRVIVGNPPRFRLTPIRIVVANPPKPVPTVEPFLTPFAGGTVLPVYPPNPRQYAVGGIVLDSQPILCNAPILQGTIVPAGSTFTLEFSNASSATRTALANGSTVTLTFALFGGYYVSGPVVLTSTLSSTTFQVSATLLSQVQVNTRVVHSQFF